MFRKGVENQFVSPRQAVNYLRNANNNNKCATTWKPAINSSRFKKSPSVKNYI